MAWEQNNRACPSEAPGKRQPKTDQPWAGRRALPTGRQGFTLVEILIVISILGVLTSLLVATTRSSDKSIFLFTEQAKLIGVIARAKSLSIETFAEENICGYGIHFRPSENKYLIYRYKDTTETCNAKAFSNAEADIIDDYFLPEGLEFETDDSGELPNNLTDIFFSPPQPTVTFTPTQSNAEIPLKITDRETRAKVTVSYAGQITTE